MTDDEKIEDKKTIRLDQLLKLRGAADSGGQAKAMVQAGEVKVNGEVDTRRGRKLQVGDIVEARGKKLTVDASLVSSASSESSKD